MNEKFITCKDETIKERLIKQGFKLLSQNKNKKGEQVFTFINKPNISINFSKEDNEDLLYINTLYF